MVLHPVILAGGSGTRLWPISRQALPKQFIPLLRDKTPFQDTLLRLDGLADASDPVVVCNEAHRELVEEQMRSIGVSPLAVLLEPTGRNTAPALTIAALALTDEHPDADDEPLILAMPADQIIKDIGAFQRAVRAAATHGGRGALVTFGVAPTGAETGLGYIRRGRKLEDGPTGGLFSLSAFVEKPDPARAAAYVESGEHLWNSGMFMMHPSVWLKTLARYRPDIAEAAGAAYAGGHRDGEIFFPDRGLFEACPSESIDYAVMEPAAAAGPGEERSVPCAVSPLDAGWSDLGSWSALWESAERDGHGNVIQGDAFVHAVRDSLVLSKSRLVAVIGLDEVVVIETKDAVLVTSKNGGQDVREIVARLEKERRRELESHP